MSEKLFAEFPPVTTQQWEEAIVKDLKGADYEKKLVWKTQEGFSVRPYYRAENMADNKFANSLPGEFPFVRGTRNDNSWLIRQNYCACDVAEANRLALDGLMKGVSSIGFVIDSKKSISVEEMETLLAGIELGCVEVNFLGCCPGRSRNVLESFLAVAAKKGVDPKALNASFDFSPLHSLTAKGHFCEESYAKLAECVKIAKDYPGVRVINVEAYDFNNAGSSITQELGYAMAQGSEYLAALTNLGLSATDVASAMTFTFSVGSTYFMEIAKIRAARVLWSNITKAYGVECQSAQKINIHAVTSAWNQTVYDSYVNMLRGTTEAMSAAIAGVHSLEVLPFDHAYRKAGEFSNRIARNVQSILKEESHFDKVVDPSAGSYYIETLTTSVLESAWKLFKEVEAAGGYVNQFKDGSIRAAIKAVADARDLNIAKRRQTILGSNQYPNFLEKAAEEITPEIVKRSACCAETACCGKEGDIVPLETYRGSQPFEALRLATDRSGKQPQAFMLTFGNLAMCRARAQFSCNFFAVAGFKVVDNNRFSSVEDGVKAALEAGAEIIVACSADDEYLEAVPKIAQLVGDKAVVVVAGDPECRPQLEEQGIKNFINVRCNVLETLKEYQKMMGIDEL